jgi:hypothetical protein
MRVIGRAMIVGSIIALFVEFAISLVFLGIDPSGDATGMGIAIAITLAATVIGAVLAYVVGRVKPFILDAWDELSSYVREG